jgi:integrase
MATLSTHKGRRIIQWPDATGKRHTLSLGGIDRKGAESVRRHVEYLLAAQANGQAPPMETTHWLNSIGERLHGKLAAHKLVTSRKPPAATELLPYLERYIVNRTDLKPESRDILGQVKKHLVAHFGPRQAIEHINRGDARDYRRYLTTVLADATVSMHVIRARQIFGDALDRKLIAENPFKGLPAGDQTNEARLVYVPKATVARVIDAVPDLDWKLVFGLARYAGLRTPSETFRLRWADVLWDQRRMVVRSPKTERHKGKASRVVPLAPELLPLLHAAFDAAPEGSSHVIQRRAQVNPGVQGKRLVARAGLSPWPKTFQNLRASCETDWCDELPLAAACAMIGNSARIARKHYLSVKDEHFDRIAGGSAAKSAAPPAPTGAKMTPSERENADSTAESALLSAQDRILKKARSPLEKAVAARIALQKALRSAETRLSSFRPRALARLDREVRRARRRKAGGL